MIGVPVGEAEAAVGFGAADLFGLGSAVNAVAGTIEADPGGADGVIRAGWDGEFVIDLFGFFGFGENGGIKKVTGIGGGFGHVKGADGALLHFGGDAAGKMSDEVGGFAEDIDGFAVEMNAGEGGFFARGRIDARDFDKRSRRDIRPVDLRVLFFDEGGGGAAAFRNQFEEAFVVETLLLGFLEPGGRDFHDAAEVFLGDGVGDEKGFVDVEGVFGVGVEFAADGEVIVNLPGKQGAPHVLAHDAVNAADGNAETDQSNLGFEDVPDGMGAGSFGFGPCRTGHCCVGSRWSGDRVGAGDDLVCGNGWLIGVGAGD